MKVVKARFLSNDWNEDLGMPEVYEKENFAFDPSEVSSFNRHDDTTCVQFKNGRSYVVYVSFDEFLEMYNVKVK